MSDSLQPHGLEPTGSSIHGIFQARVLEWVAISFSNAWKWKVKVKSLSRVQLSDPMDCSLQAPPSMGFSRQEYWSGVPLPLCLNFGMCVCAQLLSPVRFFVVPCTVAYQASLSMEFARQEYWCGLLFPPPGNFPDPGIKPTFPASQADSLVLSHKGSPSKQWRKLEKDTYYIYLYLWRKLPVLPF